MPGREEALERARLATYRTRLDEQALYGAGAMGAVGAMALASGNSDSFQASYQDRAQALRDVGARDFDPQLRQTYLNQGPYGLVTEPAAQRLNALIPPGVANFEPADLSQAGQVPALLQQTSAAADGPVQRQVTVSPGPSPRRLSYEGLTPDDLVPGQGQKGYIWANPGEPQYGYAHGNFSRGRVQAQNPAINLLAVELDPAQETRFRTTGEIVEDPAFAEDRRWGQRQFGRAKGDVMFPKEAIRARAEVTAADLYTRLKQEGALPVGFEERNLSPRGFNASTALKELTETFAERQGRPPVEALLEVASPVDPLGTSTRKAGQLPVFQQFALEQASPEARRRGGIGTVFQESWNGGRGGAERDLLVSTVREHLLEPEEHFRINPDLVSPRRSQTGNFLRRQSGLGMATAGALASPEVIEAFEQGRPAEATARAGTALFAGAVTEAISKQALSAMAERGVTAPLRAVSTVAPPLAAVQLATLAQRTTPQTPRQRQAEARQNPGAVGAQGPSADPQLLRAEAARRRGGRWRVGPFTVPELGLSEAGGLFFR
jgi:hypothetical protein